MNTLIVFACVLAAASAGLYNGHATSYSTYHGNNGYNGYNGYNNYIGYNNNGQVRQIDPVAIAAGAPLPHGDTHEVAAAKAAHLHAHAAATAHHAAAAATASPAHAHDDYHYAQAAPVAHAYTGHYAHAAPVAHVGYGEPRLVDPVAIAAGAPLPGGDTAEVAHAKALHFKAHAARNYGHQLHY